MPTTLPARHAGHLACAACAIGHHDRCLDGACDCPHRADPATRAAHSLTQLTGDLRALLTSDALTALSGPLAIIAAAIPDLEQVK